MHALLARLAAGEILLADGGLGTQLIAAGLAPGQCPEAFNLERPELLADIARAYAEAGADIVTSNSFGGSPLKLAQYGLAKEAKAVNAAAVRAARRGGGDGVYVAGCVGPTGKVLKPYGDVEPEQVLESYRIQIAALLTAGVDLIFVETMTDLSEATLAVKAARELDEKLPIAATMTFDPTPRGFFTIMGADLPRAAAGLAEAGADIVGSNCGNGSDVMLEIASELKRHATRPLLIQPNAGLPEMRGGETVYPETPEFMAQRGLALAELGVGIIGGCCGTTPAHIKALRAAIDSR